MSENVKIKILEKDNTSPAGRGIDSTDIAFVPGFSTLPNAPKNVPTLVTSTLEFESIFGKQPRILTTKDVAGYSQYGFKSGDFDRSYVYAKELLFQGLPILYANLEQDVTDASEDVVTLVATTEEEPNIAPEGEDAYTVSVSDNSIQVNFLKDTDKEISFTFNCSLNIPKRSTETKGKSAVTKATYTTYDLSVKASDLEVKGLTLDTTNISLTHSRLTLQYNNILEFVNSTEIDEEVKIPVTVSIYVDALKGSSYKIELVNNTASILDAFYGTNPVIKDLLALGTAEQPVDNTISDKSVYSVKYITSGGYPSVVSVDAAQAKQIFSSEMLACAEKRGEAVALIDYQLAIDEKVYAIGADAKSVYSKMHALFNSDASVYSYGAAMYPWSTYNCGATLSFPEATTAFIEMPASFGYLMCLAKAIKSSPNWLAMAGVTRGVVPSISKLLVPNNSISNAVAEEMQPKFGDENHKLSINTITNIRPYGLTLWGNRTLKTVSKDGTVALNFLNTRNMLSDIKKLLYTTAKSCMFEQDSTDLWIKFKNGIEPLLRRMKAGNGISDYQIVRGTTKYNGDPLTKGEIAAVIKVYPMYAVEYFELAVEINDEEVTVS